MGEDMSATQLPLTLIVAATVKNGIGKGGGLPWPMLKKDMAYFARVTKRVPLPKDTGSVQSDELKKSNLEGAGRNVVIMGRKTWESIPTNFRPLKDRTNIVISRQDRSSLSPLPNEVIVAQDIHSGLATLDELVRQDKALPTNRVYVIGGSSIYQAALKLPNSNRILLTRIMKDYDCDTFFPISLDGPSDTVDSAWRKATHQDLEGFVGEEVPDGVINDHVDGEDIGLAFQLWERK